MRRKAVTILPTAWSIASTIAATVLDVLPIAAIIIVFQVAVIRRRVPNVRRLVVGFAYVLVGLSLFLVGLELEPKMLWAMRHKLLGLGGL